MDVSNTVDLYKNIRKEKTKTIDILKNISINLSLTASGSYLVYNTLSSNDKSLITSNLVTTMSLIVIKHLTETFDIIKKEVESLKEVNSVLRTTDQYKELEELYKNYINKLAILIKSEFHPSTKEYIYIFDALLKEGYLSLTNKYEHKEPKWTMQTIPELSGAKLFSGNAVCLDEAEFLTSLLNELNIKAITIPVITRKNKLPHFLVDNGINAPSHAITGVINEDEVYLYCQTSRIMLNSLDNKYTYKATFPLDKIYYYCIKSFLENLNYGNKEIIDEFFKKKQPKDNSVIGDMFWSLDSTAKVLLAKEKFMEFNNMHKDDMEQMSNLIKVLSPYSY